MYRSNPSNYPGWHLNSDKTFCNSFIEFLYLLVEKNPGLKRTINLGKPDSHQYDIPAFQYNVKAEAKLVIVKSSQ